MDDAMLKKFAVLRLEANQRKCDGCGIVIGRFTDKCYYDKRTDRAYCSTGGCAERVRSQAPCSSCSNTLNPFEEKVHEVPGVGSVCVLCMTEVGKDTTKLRGLKVVNPDTVTGLTPEERQRVDEGPYVVVEARPGFYQVALPIDAKKHVRATGDHSVLLRLLKKCASYNAEA